MGVCAFAARGGGRGVAVNVESESRNELPLVQRIGAVLWPSFFAAAAATGVCFSLLDPLTVSEQSFPNWQLSRELGYTLGFFAFWVATASSSLFTWLLLRPANEVNILRSPER